MLGYARTRQDTLGYAGICWDTLGYARYWEALEGSAETLPFSPSVSFSCHLSLSLFLPFLRPLRLFASVHLPLSLSLLSPLPPSPCVFSALVYLLFSAKSQTLAGAGVRVDAF